VKYCFSISGVSGARNALNRSKWNEIGNRHSARRGFPCRSGNNSEVFRFCSEIGPLEPKISRGIKLL
jgi:hypothetical protein